MKLTINICEPCPHAMKKMSDRAIERKLYYISWACVHPQNTGFPTLFKTKREADAYRRDHASAHVVVRVAVVPLYGKYSKKAAHDAKRILGTLKGT